MPCNGASDQTCGGPNRLDLYSFGENLPATTTSTTSPTKIVQSTTTSQSAVSDTTTVADGPTGTVTQPTQSEPTSPLTDPTTVPLTTAASTAAATPSTGVNSTAILPFKYSGCYTDSSSNGRALTAGQPDSQSMTVESCISQCSSLGYHIAGLQYADQCFCDNFLHNSPSLAPESDSNMACAGNAQEMCGAGNRNSIYTNGLFP